MDKANEKAPNVFCSVNFCLVFFGSLVSELGAVLYNFAVSFYILEISGNNAFLQGLYLAVCGIVLLVFTPLGGVFGDRFNKARIMYLCDFAKGGAIILGTVFMLLFPGNDAHMLVLFTLGVIGNLIGGIFTPAAGALIPFIVDENSLQQANSYFSVKNSINTVFGIVLAGILYAAMPIQLLFFIVGVCYILSGVSELFIRCPYAAKEGDFRIGTALSDMKEGFLYLKEKKAIMVIMLAALFINSFITPIDGNFLPFFTKTDLTNAPHYLFDGFLSPELWYSAFGMLLGISSLIGSVILSTRPPEKKCGKKTAIRICCMAVITIIITLAYALFVKSGRSINAFLLTLSLGSIALGISIVFVNIPLNTALMRAVDKSMMSKVSSILSTISQGLIPVASVIAGAVLQYLGSTVLLLVCSVGLAFTSLFLLLNRHTDEI